MSAVTIELLRCPHGTEALAVAEPWGSTTLTGASCCGHWDVIKEFKIADHEELITAIEYAAESNDG